MNDEQAKADTVDRPDEAPQLTPVFNSPTHIDNHEYGNEDGMEEHYSRVFHRDHLGRIVAIFYGKNHRADSQAYCDWCQERDGKPDSPKPTRISG